MPKKINPELRARALLPELPCGRPFGVLGLLVADEECQKFRRQAEDATAGTRLRPCGVGRGLVTSRAVPGRSRPHVPSHPCRYLGRSRLRRTRRTPA